MKSSNKDKKNNLSINDSYTEEEIRFDEEELDKLKMSNLVLYTKYKKEIDMKKKKFGISLEKKIE